MAEVLREEVLRLVAEEVVVDLAVEEVVEAAAEANSMMDHRLK